MKSVYFWSSSLTPFRKMILDGEDCHEDTENVTRPNRKG